MGNRRVLDWLAKTESGEEAVGVRAMAEICETRVLLYPYPLR